MAIFSKFFLILSFLIGFLNGEGEIVDLNDEGILTIAVGESSEESVIDREPRIEKQILVLANHFPDYLNFFCQPRTTLMRDRFCYGSIDAYSIACAQENPPLQLVPFCFGYKYQCSKLSFPADDWCDREFDHYERHCTRAGRMTCKSCYYDLDCICEPYYCLLAKVGTRTAEWCQRYELFCNATAREDKRAELNGLMGDAVRVHKQCVDLWGLADAICNPFTRNFQWERCEKFLLDCELISDFPDDQQTADSIVSTSQVLTKDQLNKQILEASDKANTKETIPKHQHEDRQNLAREKGRISEDIPQPSPTPIESQEPSTIPIKPSPQTDLSGLPEFFVGQAKKQGGRIVINKVKVEPGEVIDRIMHTSTQSSPLFNVSIRPPNIDFLPEEVFKVATDVGTGKVKPVT